MALIGCDVFGRISRALPPAEYRPSNEYGLLSVCAGADSGVGVCGATVGCENNDLQRSSNAYRLEFSERPVD